MDTRKRIIVTVVACLAAVAVVLVAFVNKLTTPRTLSAHELREYGAMVLDSPRRFSDFTMVDHRGDAFTKSDLEGKWTLVFFGFTHCPDICPTTLATLARVYEPLTEEEKANLQVVLLSVDPERDTMDKLAQYVPYFHPDFIGIRANPAELLSFATQLGVVYNKVPLEGDDYTIDHSGTVVIINPRGDYHGFFRPPFEEGSLRVAWRSLARSFER